MDSVASSSYVVGAVAVVVVLAGQVLGSVVFCVLKSNNIFNSFKTLTSSLSSLTCEMSVASLVTGVYIV